MRKFTEWRKLETLCFAGILLLLFGLFAIRQFYGFNKNDEVFYISTVYRFFQGDAMLIDEWNNGQLFALITYPLYCLTRLILPSNDGIVLIFRMYYLIFQMTVSIYCYARLKRFGSTRILPALFYFITTPYNINNLSYNTLTFGLVLITLVTFAGVEDWKPPHSFLCGVFTAGAVLANPYTIFLYVIYGTVCIGHTLRCRKKQNDTSCVYSLKSFLWLSVGAFAVFLLFCAFVFSRGNLGEILESLSSIVMDAERQKPFLWKLARYFIRLRRYYPGLVYLTGILIGLYLVDRKRRIPLGLYMPLEILMTIPYVVYYGFFWDMVGINYMLVPLLFPGLIAWLVTEHRDQRLFWEWYMPGLFFTLLMHFATDTGILTMSASCVVPSAASILLLCQAAKEKNGQKGTKVILGILLAIQFIGGTYQRIFYVWGDSALPELTETITEGPLTGIRTTEDNALLYREVMNDLEELNLTSEDQLLVVGIAPWIYLSTDAECAAYSTWTINETDELLFSYYELHPEKKPTVVYFYGYDETTTDTEFIAGLLGKDYETQSLKQGFALVYRKSD